MERYAWKAKVKSGKMEEYIRRHQAIWPQLVSELKRAGICNYSIWNVGDELFGYYECTHGIAYASQVQTGSQIVAQWNSYMKDILIMEMDPQTGVQPQLNPIFFLE